MCEIRVHFDGQWGENVLATFVVTHSIVSVSAKHSTDIDDVVVLVASFLSATVETAVMENE